MLDEQYALTNEQVAQYQRDGHILLEDVLDAVYIPPYKEAIEQTVAERNKETRALKDRDTYGKAFLQTTNLWEHNGLVKEYVTAKRFAGIAARLMGVARARLYHDQALFKEAGGGITPWHQDQHYWPLATNNTITMWMTLADIDADMGTLRFASGSHVEGYLGDIPISDESEAQLRAFVEQKGFKLGQADVMKAGSATFHSGWTLHSAPPEFLRADAARHDRHLLRRWRAGQRARQQAPRQRPRPLAAGHRAGRSGGDAFESGFGMTAPIGGEGHEFAIAYTRLM